MIDVFIDTNILHSRNEQLDKALFVEKLKEIIGEIEINDIYTEIKILLPRMVLNELYQTMMRWLVFRMLKVMQRKLVK